jgi:tRNA G37 N-methylase TrmD
MTKEKVQKDKRSTKYTHKTNDRVTRTSLKTMGAAECRQFLLQTFFGRYTNFVERYLVTCVQMTSIGNYILVVGSTKILPPSW